MKQYDCTDIKALLSAIVDDEVNADQRHLVERHLADCKPCRTMLDEAEAVDAVLALEPGVDGALPAGFEDAVLAQTVHTNHMHIHHRRWVTLGGWVASAAAIALAMTIWIVDRRALMRQPQPQDSDTTSRIAAEGPLALTYTSGISNSWIYEGPVDTAPRSKATSTTNAATSDGAVAAVEPSTMERIVQSVTMTREDAETIFAAALALDQIRDSDALSFSDLDTVRRVVEYDELLPRLGGAHTRLNAEDRAALLATESIFTRIVRGPIGAEDLEEIAQTITTLELPERLTRIARRSDATMSL